MHRNFEFLKPLNTLFKASGYELYLVGGCVRDVLMGQVPADYDLATDALPQTSKLLLEQAGAKIVDKTGGHFGTVMAVYRDQPIEISTYRADKDAPSQDFSLRLEDDLRRRDFTINAIAMTVDGTFADSGICRTGKNDLLFPRALPAALYTPIEANRTIADDPLRILRAYRFAMKFDLSLDEDLRAAIRRFAPRLKAVSVERVQTELVKIAGGPRPHVAFRMMMEDGVMPQLFPELLKQVGFDQENPHHHLPLWEHTLETVKQASRLTNDPVVVLAALLHDISKPTCWQARVVCSHCGRRLRSNEQDSEPCSGCNLKLGFIRTGKTYQGHGGQGATMAQEALQALKFSGDDIRTIGKLIEAHDGYYGVEWNTRNVRRFANRMGDHTDRMIALMKADRLAHAPSHDDPSEYEVLQDAIKNIPDDMGAIKPIVDGRYVMHVTGLKPGKELGEIMKQIKQMTVDGDLVSKLQAQEWLLGRGLLCPNGKRLYLEGE